MTDFDPAPTMTTAGQPGEAKMERERFEKWEMDTFGWEALDRMTDAQDAYYCDSQVQHDWGVWQAAATPPGAAGQAYGYLVRLFAVVAPQCTPLPDLMGICTQIDNYIAGLRARHASPLPEQAAVEKMARAIYEASPSSRKQNGDLRLTWENMLPQFPEACEMWRTVARAAYAALHGEG